MALLDGDIAALFGEAFGGLYLDGTLHGGLTLPIYDGAGNITGYTGEVDVPVKYQRDAASWAMRRDEGFVEGDVQIIVLTKAGSQYIAITTDHELSEASGAKWKIKSADLDAAGSHWICRARAA